MGVPYAGDVWDFFCGKAKPEKSLPKGVVLYYPREGESEWEIAKRFRFSQEALQKRNPEGKAPYLIFRRLTGE